MPHPHDVESVAGLINIDNTKYSPDLLYTRLVQLVAVYDFVFEYEILFFHCNYQGVKL